MSKRVQVKNSKNVLRVHTKKVSKQQVWKIFSQYIRLRDCYKTTKTTTHGICYTCGKRLPLKQLQAGHILDGRE